MKININIKDLEKVMNRLKLGGLILILNGLVLLTGGVIKILIKRIHG
jgi:hypothetical protein